MKAFSSIVRVVLLTLLLTLAVPANSHAATTQRIVFSRGTWLAWSKDYVQWNYDGARVIWSSGWQSSGWVFPSIVRTLGNSRYYGSRTVHRYRATKTIAAGVPTPWSDINLYSATYIDYQDVYASGHYRMYQ